MTQEIVSEFGQTYTWDIKTKMLGLKETMAAQILVDSLQIPLTTEEYLRRRNKMQNERFPDCKPLPGVEKLVCHLKSRGIPIAVATSSHRGAYNVKTSKNTHLFELFDAIVTGDDPNVAKGKPAPDIFLEAAKRLGYFKPHECLVFEDSPAGVEGAVNAGMKICWVPDRNCVRDNQFADMIIDSLVEFDPSFFGLPPYFN